MRARRSATRAATLAGADIVLGVQGPDPASLAGVKPGRVGGRGAQSVRRARAGRRLCRGRARGAGDGIHAAHHPRAVDGHPLVAVEPRRLQGGARRGRRIWPRLPDDDDRGGHGQRRQGLRDGRRRRRAAGDRHRAAAGRAGLGDRRALGDQGADPVARRQADLRRERRGDRGRGRGRLRHRDVATNTRRRRPNWSRATSPSRTSSSPPR